jgi:hypothetical protein
MIKTKYDTKIIDAIKKHCVPSRRITEAKTIKTISINTNSLFHLISEVGSINDEELKERVINGENFTKYSDRIITRYQAMDNGQEIDSVQKTHNNFSELVYDSNKDAIMISTTELEKLDNLITKEEWRYKGLDWIVESGKPLYNSRIEDLYKNV